MMTHELDLLSVFPGHMSVSQQEAAVQTLHQLVLENHSLSDIVQIAQDHALDNQPSIQAISAQAIKPGDTESYERLIRLMLFSMMKKAETVADFIHYAATNRVKYRAMELPTSVFRSGLSSSPLQMSSGEMVSTKAINFMCQNQAMMHLLMIHMMGRDDPEELKYLLSVPRVSQVYDPNQVSSWLCHFNNSLGPRLRDCYFSTEVRFSPKSHQEFYKEMLAISNLKDATASIPSAPAFARAIGHELIVELGKRKDSGAIRVIQKLIEDGADWFIGFEMMRLGRFAYYDLVDRKADFTSELSAVMHNAKRNDCKSLGFALIQALGEKPFIQLAFDQKSADSLWKEWRLPFLVERVSERYQAEILSADLGL